MLHTRLPLLLLTLLASLSAHATPTPRIIGGNDAANGEYPFLVALVHNSVSNTDFDDHFCGGTIIGARWILTASHCITESNGSVTPAGDIRVIAGVTLLDTAGRSGTRTVVDAIVRHPAYDDSTLANDVALLHLASDVAVDPDFTWADAGVLDTLVLPGDDLVAAGWGAVDQNGTATPFDDTYDPQLQEVVLDYIPLADCNARGLYGGDLQAGMTCAGFLAGTPRDTCSGDSGGPLLYAAGGGQWRQVGITSFGDTLCADPARPGVYADVGDYDDFIAGAQVSPDLSVQLALVNREGRTATLAVTLRNHSPVNTATGASLSLTRSHPGVGLALAAGSATCTGAGDLDCDLPDLGPGGIQALQFAVTLPGNGRYTVTADTAATAGDYFPGNNQASERVGSGGSGGGAAGIALLAALAAVALRRRDRRRPDRRRN